MKNISIVILPILLSGCANLARNAAPVSLAPERPTFQIQSPSNYVASFFVKDLHKTQFETQAGYEARIHSLQPTGQNVFLQVEAGLIHYVYNAEQQNLLVMLPPDIAIGWDSSAYSTRRQSDDRLPHFTVGRTTKNWGIGTGKNASGESAFVTRLDDKSYWLSVLNLNELPPNVRWRESDSSFSGLGIGLVVPLRLYGPSGPYSANVVGSQDAERIVEAKSLTLIFGITVGDLHGAGHYTAHNTATMTNPFQFDDDIYEIPVRITDVKVYNTQTGYVLASWTKPGT